MKSPTPTSTSTFRPWLYKCIFIFLSCDILPVHVHSFILPLPLPSSRRRRKFAHWSPPTRYQNKDGDNLLLRFATSSDELKEYEDKKRIRGDDANAVTASIANVDVSNVDRVQGNFSMDGSSCNDDGNDDSRNENIHNNYDTMNDMNIDSNGGSSDTIDMNTFASRLKERAAVVAEANAKRNELMLQTKRIKNYQHKPNNHSSNGNNHNSMKLRDSLTTSYNYSSSPSSSPASLINTSSGVTSSSQESSSSTTAIAANNKNDSNSKSTLMTLSHLNQKLDNELKTGGVRGRNDYESRISNASVTRANDSMQSLLKHNYAEGKWLEHYSDATRNVVIVFGKKLIRDQITVEYASRIRSLANMFKTEAFLPSLVCFCGGRGKGNQVADADAGYIFFRHMCEAQNISLDEVEIYVDSTSKDEREAIVAVTNRVVQMLPRWLEASPKTEQVPGFDSMGKRFPPRKKVNVHFTLVSTEYHLCNLNDIHNRSPNQSWLKPLDDLKEISSQPFRLPDPNAVYNTQTSSEYDADSISLLQRAVINPSISFQHATYPYIYSKDPSIAYLGKCYILAEKIMPMRVNIEAVIDRKEFFQRDNFLALTSIRRSLVSKMEELHKPPIELRKGLRLSSSNASLRKVKGLDTMAVDVVMEGALLSLSRCIDLIRPAGLHTNRVPENIWAKALAFMDYTTNEIRQICDPDRPLRPSEWGKLVDDEATVLATNVAHKAIEDVNWRRRWQNQPLSTFVQEVSNKIEEVPDHNNFVEESFDMMHDDDDGEIVNASFDGLEDDYSSSNYDVESTDLYQYDDVDDFEEEYLFEDGNDDYPIYDENSLLISLDD